MAAAHPARGGETFQRGERLRVLGAVDGDVAGGFKMLAVDLHIAGQQHAGAAFAPETVQAFMARGGPVAVIGQAFRHRGLCQAIRQHGAAWQWQGLIENIRGVA